MGKNFEFYTVNFFLVLELNFFGCVREVVGLCLEVLYKSVYFEILEF